MSEPLVCAIMLTRDRPGMAKRALRCFENQTEAHRLFILDTGQEQFFPDHSREVLSRVRYHYEPGARGRSIGHLRNYANIRATEAYRLNVLIHWDDDDWSHPNRISEQVALLQASGADAVGYNEMMFWRTKRIGVEQLREGPTTPLVTGEAWLYSNAVDKRYCIGTSLCYWRKTWEAKPFPDLPSAKGSTSEDTAWCKGLNTVGISSVGGLAVVAVDGPTLRSPNPDEPRMIATIHGGNTMPYNIEEKPFNWKRVPEWDARVRETMEGA